jgi:hypothetical protein
VLLGAHARPLVKCLAGLDKWLLAAFGVVAATAAPSDIGGDPARLSADYFREGLWGRNVLRVFERLQDTQALRTE